MSADGIRWDAAPKAVRGLLTAHPALRSRAQVQQERATQALEDFHARKVVVTEPPPTAPQEATS